MDLPLGSVGLVCVSVVSVVASVVSLSVVETVLKETKQLVKERFDSNTKPSRTNESCFRTLFMVSSMQAGLVDRNQATCLSVNCC